MKKITLYNMEGRKVGEEKLNPQIFEVKINEDVIHRVLIAQQASRRKPLAHTKTRGEVRGGGIKPWRQKGTGRARAGSIRSPIWRGGGVIFGPRKEKVFIKRVNKKEKRKALFMVLSFKAKEKLLILIDHLSLKKIKTKDFLKILENLPLKKVNALVALPKKDEKIIKSAANLPGIGTILANSLNIEDILKHEYLILPKASLKVIEETFLKT